MKKKGFFDDLVYNLLLFVFLLGICFILFLRKILGIKLLFE